MPLTAGDLAPSRVVYHIRRRDVCHLRRCRYLRQSRSGRPRERYAGDLDPSLPVCKECSGEREDPDGGGDTADLLRGLDPVDDLGLPEWP